VRSPRAGPGGGLAPGAPRSEAGPAARQARSPPPPRGARAPTRPCPPPPPSARARPRPKKVRPKLRPRRSRPARRPARRALPRRRPRAAARAARPLARPPQACSRPEGPFRCVGTRVEAYGGRKEASGSGTCKATRLLLVKPLDRCSHGGVTRQGDVGWGVDAAPLVLIGHAASLTPY
jgi:hypothetical protein